MLLATEITCPIPVADKNLVASKPTNTPWMELSLSYPSSCAQKPLGTYSCRLTTRHPAYNFLLMRSLLASVYTEQAGQACRLEKRPVLRAVDNRNDVSKCLRGCW